MPDSSEVIAKYWSTRLFTFPEFMRTQIGVHEFLNPRQDGKTQYEITSELCDAYQAIEKCQFEDLSPFDQNKTYALFGKNDTLVHGHDEFIAHYKKTMQDGSRENIG